MEDFYSKTEYTFDDVRLLIENEVEESIHLDFKEANALDKSDGKRKDLSKDVASFANSDGGIIVYGLKEENHKAKTITYINGNEYTKEWLEQVINSSIQRKISNLLIIPLRNQGKIEETVYIVKIPKSMDAPHISRDKKFYKRYNFESVPMEEYEIRQSYGQKLKSKLVIDKIALTYLEEETKESKLRFKLEVDIGNVGEVIEDSYKTNVYFDNFDKRLTLTWPRETNNYFYTRMSDDKIKVSATSVGAIFPNELMNTLRFTIEIDEKDVKYIFDKVSIEVKLIYSSGEDTLDTSFNSFFQDILKEIKRIN